MEQLNEQGYLLIPGALNSNQVENAKLCITDDRVNYKKMTRFVENDMFDILRANFGWSPIFNKYRLSNNNNSTDAAIFHTDGMCCDPEMRTIPIYTFLTYMDASIMELFPGSHKKKAANVLEAMEMYSGLKEIHINPGDVLIFNFAVIHRGIFSNGQKDRRILQIFEISPNQEIFNQYHSKIAYLPPADLIEGRVAEQIAKYKILNVLPFYMIYLNVATGNGHKYGQELLPGIMYVCSERHRPRGDLNDENGELNIHVHKFKEIIDINPELIDIYLSNIYRNLYIYIIFLIIILIAVGFGVKKTYNFLTSAGDLEESEYMETVEVA